LCVIISCASSIDSYWGGAGSLLERRHNIRVLSPTPQLVADCDRRDCYNDRSHVLKVNYGGRSLILPGDAEAPAWDLMLEDLAAAELACDLLKVWLWRTSHDAMTVLVIRTAGLTAALRAARLRRWITGGSCWRGSLPRPGCGITPRLGCALLSRRGLRKAVTRSPPMPWEELVFFADGEDLAEGVGGVERFLAKLAPLLRRHGLQLQVRSVQDPHRAGDPELDYVVEINGVRCTVWRPQEWEGLPLGGGDRQAAGGGERPAGAGA